MLVPKSMSMTTSQSVTPHHCSYSLDRGYTHSIKNFPDGHLSSQKEQWYKGLLEGMVQEDESLLSIKWEVPWDL